MYKSNEAFILRMADSAIIPRDINNRDFRDYLEWLDAGNIPVEDTIDEVKAKQLADLAEYRYLEEISGTVWNGSPVSTDRDSQSKVNAAYTMARDGFWSGGWKFADGRYRAMTANQILAMALAVSAHVAGCFVREAEIAAQIEAATALPITPWVW